MTAPKVLVVASKEPWEKTAVAFLSATLKCQVKLVRSEEELLVTMGSDEEYDIVFVDSALGSGSPIELAHRIKTCWPKVAAVFYATQDFKSVGSAAKGLVLVDRQPTTLGRELTGNISHYFFYHVRDVYRLTSVGKAS